MAAVVAEEEQAPVMGEEAVMGEEQTLSLVMEEREPARSEEASRRKNRVRRGNGRDGRRRGRGGGGGPAHERDVARLGEALVRRRARGLPPISTWNTVRSRHGMVESGRAADWMNGQSHYDSLRTPYEGGLQRRHQRVGHSSSVTNMSFMFHRFGVQPAAERMAPTTSRIFTRCSAAPRRSISR